MHTHAHTHADISLGLDWSRLALVVSPHELAASDDDDGAGSEGGSGGGEPTGGQPPGAPLALQVGALLCSRAEESSFGEVGTVCLDAQATGSVVVWAHDTYLNECMNGSYGLAQIYLSCGWGWLLHELQPALNRRFGPQEPNHQKRDPYQHQTTERARTIHTADWRTALCVQALDPHGHGGMLCSLTLNPKTKPQRQFPCTLLATCDVRSWT